MEDNKIDMLDKTSEEWRKIPMWVRAILWPVNDRQAAIRLEVSAAILAALLLIFMNSTLLGAIALICAFLCAGAIKWVDNADLWEQNGA